MIIAYQTIPMKIYIAEEAGFCFGVKRALDTIDRLYEEGRSIQVYGQLIHNRTVLDDLAARGIECIDSLDRLAPGKTLVIRTHGIPREEEAYLKSKNVDVVDATCPLVKKLHHTIEKAYESDCAQYPDHQILIVGDRYHPEIVAARSYAPGAVVIGTEEDARNLEDRDCMSVVAQTTLDSQQFEGIISILEEKTRKLFVHNTICNATKVRQEAIRKLAPNVDAVLVVGGKNSSNTRKLFNIARNLNPRSFHIENSTDLRNNEIVTVIARVTSVGITAGASTPPEEIERIKRNLININLQKESNHGETKRDKAH